MKVRMRFIIIEYTIQSIVCEASCHPVTWSLGHLGTWALGHSITQSLSHLVTWSLGHLVTQSLGHSVTQSPSHFVTIFNITTYGLTYNIRIYRSALQTIANHNNYLTNLPCC